MATNVQNAIAALEVANLTGTGIVFGTLAFLLNQSEKRIMDRIAHLMLLLAAQNVTATNDLANELETALQDAAQELRQSVNPSPNKPKKRPNTPR